MSTKTTFKRIALVAVAALGLGVVSSVAPANAGNTANANVTGITVTAKTTPPRVGLAQTTTFKISNALTASGETFQFRAMITEKPSTSLLNAYTGVTFTDAGIALVDSASQTATGVATAGDTATALGPKLVVSPSGSTTFPLINATTGTKLVAGSISFTPDVAGVYKIVVFSDSGNTGSLVAGSKSATWTVTAAGAPATATVSAVSTTAAACTSSLNDTNFCSGALLKVTLKDANGYATAPRGAELVTVTSGSTTTTPAKAAPVTLSSSNVDLNGIAWLNFSNTAAETVVYSVAGGGSVASATGLTAVASVSYTAATQFASSSVAPEILSTQTGVGTKAAFAVSPAANTASTATTGITYKVTAAAAGVVGVQVVDTDSAILGDATYASHSYTIPVTITSDGAATPVYSGTFTITAAPADADEYTLHVWKTASTSYSSTITYADPEVNQTNSTLTPATPLAVVGGSVTFTATIKDAYGNVVPSAGVSFTVAGRNVAKTGYATTADAKGVATFTLTDASVSTTSLTDTIGVVATAFGEAGVTITATAVINWKTAIDITTVAITTPDTTAGVADTVSEPVTIDASSGGAQTTLTDVTAKVTDVNGVVVVGVPVTFTISGTTGAAVLSTFATAYTSSTGVATSKIYGWIAGTYTVTATAGGKSSTGSVTFLNSTPLTARTVSATVEGQIVTALVKDRFGNPIKGVKIYATKTGVGYFGNGLSSTDGLTNASGKVEFNTAGGALTVTVSAVDPTAAAGTTYGQTCAAATKVSCAATATALLASTAGTATLAENYVGSSFAPAGVASATVEVTGDQTAQAAADAAAEATDAANAATDAANAAAEAADAATAAAQDAADAVAALSTSVSEMINALKKQITSLTNLVIKIQKKVRA